STQYGVRARYVVARLSALDIVVFEEIAAYEVRVCLVVSEMCIRDCVHTARHTTGVGDARSRLSNLLEEVGEGGINNWGEVVTR
ncbi:hypothetical protein BGV06_19375, partial [Clostridioides difficile]